MLILPFVICDALPRPVWVKFLDVVDDVILHVLSAVQTQGLQPAQEQTLIQGVVAFSAQGDDVLSHTHSALASAHNVTVRTSRSAANDAPASIPLIDKLFHGRGDTG